MGFTFQNIIDQVRENTFWPNFNKNRTAGIIDRFDLILEVHRVQDMTQLKFVELLPDQTGIAFRWNSRTQGSLVS